MRPSTASVGARQTIVYYTGTKKMVFSRIYSSIIAERKFNQFSCGNSLRVGHFPFQI